MDNAIEYYVREVYGRRLRYVVDPEEAEAIRQMSGLKTLDDRTMKGLETLGLRFVEVLKPAA